MQEIWCSSSDNQPDPGRDLNEIRRPTGDTHGNTFSGMCSVLLFLSFRRFCFVDFPLIFFPVQQTTYRIGNHVVYYWVWLRHTRSVNVKNTTTPPYYGCSSGWITLRVLKTRYSNCSIVQCSTRTFILYCLYRYDVSFVLHKYVCVFFPFILDIKFVGRTSRGHTGGRSHRISHLPSFCGACLNFSSEKDSAHVPFPRRP